MENYLKPIRFETEPNSDNSTQVWKHWRATFENFITKLTLKEELSSQDKYSILINHVSQSVFEYVSECTTYEDAIKTLNTIYIRPASDIFSRYQLASRKQQSGESINQYLLALQILGKECNFTAVTAEQHKNIFIRDAFINGLVSPVIRQRLLENDSLSLEEATAQARTLEAAQSQADFYSQYNQTTLNATTRNTVTAKSVLQEGLSDEEHHHQFQLASTSTKCYFCGGSRHPRYKCPAKDATCNVCSKKGHYGKVCKSKHQKSINSLAPSQNDNLVAIMSAASPSCLKKAVVKVYINGIKAEALIDTGSSESFINHSFVCKHRMKVIPGGGTVSMASTTLSSSIVGHLIVDLKLQEHSYMQCKLSVLSDLCADVVIGHDLLKHHSQIQLSFGGAKSPLNVCALAQINIEPPHLFRNLTKDVRPIATKSRKHSTTDRVFIEHEVRKLLAEGIIEESQSPWRAQTLVTTSDNHKKRMVIDYSQTINRFTLLDAYPLPSIEYIVSQVSKHLVFSTIDLSSAYHQVALREDEKQYTAFEAAGQLYQFCRVPFGVTNGVACFQRVIDNIIKTECLEGTYAYLDDITVCGNDQSEHDRNLTKFLAAVKKFNLTINEKKSKYSVTKIQLLGYEIENKTVKPDEERLKPLLNLPLPTDSVSLKRAIGMLSHYSKWIPHYSKKIHSLVSTKYFPLSQQASSDFEFMKEEIAKSAKSAIAEDITFVVETDASEHSIAATLSQSGRPVAFFSRTLSTSESRHSSVEKEAYAIVESLRRWRHFLIGRHFILITDQKSVSFMFDQHHASKIKNEKILRWRLELSCYSYDITYRPGKQNEVADALSRVCGATATEKLFSLHSDLGHPGVTRMAHWIKSRNLPFSIEEIKKMTASCPVCAELKPRFYKPDEMKLIKATVPFERINLDFKGPLPSPTKNKYLLTIIDEYSRFPFAYPCTDLSASTVTSKLCDLFCLFGTPSYIHSDRGSAFMSNELKTFLHSRGIATSRTTPYNPQGNGQVERLNGTLWRTVSLILRSRHYQINQWETVLNDSLHCVRSLLCTATNMTPHERMFTYSRKSSNGQSMPTWLLTPGKVLLKRYVRQSKYDPLVDEVELIEANPNYATVRLQNGSEATVSLRHLAPKGDTALSLDNNNCTPSPTQSSTDDATPHVIESTDEEASKSEPPETSEREASSKLEQRSMRVNRDSLQNLDPRRSNRPRRTPHYLRDYYTSRREECGNFK